MLWPFPLSLLVFIATFASFRPAAALTYSPGAEPLVVRSPFLNTWNAGGSPVAGSWSFNTFDGKVTAWTGLARVDGVGYAYLGDANGATGRIGIAGTVQAINITPTQTTYTIKCGGVDLTVAFLSPIEPSDFVRMSLPFSYMSVTATPNDGAQHSVQIYSDLSGEWLSDVTNKNMTWSSQRTSSIVYHEFTLSDAAPYTVQNGRAEYGKMYHAMLLGDGVTYQVADDRSMRGWFNRTGTLNSTVDSNFRQIADQWPCFGLSKDFGTINSASSPVVFAIGHARDPAISYQTSAGPQARSLYYRTQFATDIDALSFFLNDYSAAVTSANNFDNKLNTAAAQISPNYVDLVTMAARQTFSSVELTVPTGSDGKLNASDPLLFIGPDKVNQIETIYATAPFWSWINPTLLKLLIQPVLEWHKRTQGTLSSVAYVIDDIGVLYPVATGPSNSALDSPKSLESTGDMMLATVAYVKASGDNSIVSANADLYRGWGDYLKDHALAPGSQKTTDGVTTGNNPFNDTNLAVKGIVALKAYADILNTLGQDGSSYSGAAVTYARQWQDLAATSNGLSSSYGDGNSWSLVYNIFADKWLKTNLFPDTIYQKLTSQYGAHLNKYGVPLNSGSTQSNAQWMMFAAGSVSDTELRDSLISKSQSFIQTGPFRVPWSSYFETVSGNVTSGTAGKPSIGGVYALLALNQGSTQSPGISSPSSAISTASGIPVIYQLMVASILLFALQRA
ncbi:hypothetical protein M408DRAFT_281196 [Serendipita vermifera MAFF 305830]|uniref:DUF1793-domain-containing protein n=1 Tax=Serendipita vermifera MAFF 305830 TaxID=933852 RepID=A0A0C2WZN4_SERVB|nr:hypothetical protein M408DRAFT_281196 [Serendipita vermifera MAFF 305830]